jgi:hypothetical protein
VSCHFSQICAFAAKKIFHACIAVSFAIPEKVDVFFCHLDPPEVLV